MGGCPDITSRKTKRQSGCGAEAGPPGDGRYWAKENTLLIFETNPMDEEKRGEPPGSGEYILYIDLRPKSDEPKLVYERSAWPN